MSLIMPQDGHHIDSYYVQTAGELKAFDEVEGDVRCEICVVGGGFAGLTTALELAKSGKNVVLLEANRIGWAASGRNGGFVSAGFAQSLANIEARVGLETAKKLYASSRQGVDYVKMTIEEAGLKDIIGGHGWLKLARHDDKGALRRRAAHMAKHYGVRQLPVDPEELETFVVSDAYKAGLHDPEPFHIQPVKYAALLAKNAEREGVMIFERSAALTLEKADHSNNGQRWKIATQKGVVFCEQAVMATSAGKGPYARLNRAILPVATYVLAARVDPLQLQEAIRFKGCIADTRRAGDYYRVIGSRDEPVLIWGGRITTRTGKPANLETMLVDDVRSTYPQLRTIEPLCAWMGHMGYAAHKMPIIGKLEEGLFAVSAFGGHGLAQTAMGGLLVSQAITEGDTVLEDFASYGAVPLAPAGFGLAGRLATQLEYWRLQTVDRLEESGWI